MVPLPSADPLIHRIGNLLEEEVASLREFVALLGSEESLLKTPPIDDAALSVLVTRKNTLSTRLAALFQAREQALRGLGLTADRAGMESWLARAGAVRHGPRWHDLLTLAEQAKAANAANGRLIDLSIQHNQQALRGLVSANEAFATYGPDGQQHAGIGRRLYDKA